MNPQIKVSAEYVPYEALHDKIVTAAASGSGYDIVLFDVIWPAEFATQGILRDITNEIPKSMIDQVFAGAWEILEVQWPLLRCPLDPGHAVPVLQHRDAAQGGYRDASEDAQDLASRRRFSSRRASCSTPDLGVAAIRERLPELCRGPSSALAERGSTPTGRRRSIPAAA